MAALLFYGIRVCLCVCVCVCVCVLCVPQARLPNVLVPRWDPPKALTRIPPVQPRIWGLTPAEPVLVPFGATSGEIKRCVGAHTHTHTHTDTHPSVVIVCAVFMGDYTCSSVTPGVKLGVCVCMCVCVCADCVPRL